MGFKASNLEEANQDIIKIARSHSRYKPDCVSVPLRGRGLKLTPEKIRSNSVYGFRPLAGKRFETMFASASTPAQSCVSVPLRGRGLKQLVSMIMLITLFIVSVPLRGRGLKRMIMLITLLMVIMFSVPLRGRGLKPFV